MILIADSGSTKCDWVAINNQKKIFPEVICTAGLNPSIVPREVLLQRISESRILKQYQKKITQLYFYGAGCGTAKSKANMVEILQNFFSNAQIKVEEDTFAAVYASVPDRKAAVVCILGTGSNCCYYDGNQIHQKVTSLGHSIMDDASGNYFGRQLLRGYYFGHMPKELREVFIQDYDVKADTIKTNLYKKTNPNAYLASFATFMFAHKEHPYIKELIKEGFRAFSKNMILQFKEKIQKVPVHFVGSIAFFSKNEILEIAEEFGYKVGEFVKKPIEKLAKYHIDYWKV